MLRIIGHIDMDAFFAAIEERDNPRFLGRPLVIGADPKKGHGRGVVSTANYPARKYGIHSAMPISRAWYLSEKAIAAGQPAAIFLPVDMERYQEASHSIMKVITQLVPIVEQTSIDEAYLDLSFTRSYTKAKVLAHKVKKSIYNKEKLTASIGIGPNKLVAKIASDMEKPDGLTIVSDKEAESILEPLSIRKIPGIGPKTEKMLNDQGVSIIKDLKRLSRSDLKNLMGKWGEELYQKARGQDDSPLVLEWETKSIGEQETFDEDTKSFSFILKTMNQMCESVHRSLVREGFSGYRRVVLTMRFDNFTTKTRSKTLPDPTDSLKIFKQEALKLLMPFFDKRENPQGREYRLIGIRLEDLS